MRRLELLAALILSLPLAAVPVVTSVSPSSGSTFGGMQVTITGTGFSAALAPSVNFGPENGQVPATVVSSTKITAVTPASWPGTVPVSVFQTDGIGGLPDAFTFIGIVPTTRFERILVPLLIPPAPGAVGSLFRTELSLALNENGPVTVRGLRLNGTDTEELGGENKEIRPDDVRYDGTPGRFLYVEKGVLRALNGHLRVRDVTRTALNLGTELPLVRADDFTTDWLVLRNDHPEPGYRTTLRIYAAFRSQYLEPEMFVDVYDLDGNMTEHLVELTGGATIYDPPYGYFTDFPAGGWSKVVLVPPEPILGIPQGNPPPYWAFVSMTNNETQMITTITPQW